MNLRHWMIATLIALAAIVCHSDLAQAGGTLVRWNKMGEDDPGAANNVAVSSTTDTPINVSDQVALDLGAANSPVYRTITGRPDNGSGLGIEFNRNSQQSLSGFALNWPEESPLSDDHGGQLNLTGISDRGMQFWVKPTSTAVQSIVMDTNQHGVRIDANGKFSMRYADGDYASTLSVVPNTWYHVELVRPAGVDNGVRMYINGNAVAVAIPGDDYASDTDTPITVGANTSLSGEFFGGIVDDFREFVMGSTTSGAAVNYGTFNLLTDDAYVASPITGLKNIAGDVNNDGFLTQADKDAFIAGWMHKRLVNGIEIGDMTSYAQGDLNLDGITDIQDLVLMQHALTGSGLGAISAAQLSSVPEPSALVLLICGPWLISLERRRRRR
jgi:hypothetical protein